MKNHIKAKRNIAIVSVVIMVVLKIITFVTATNELVNCILDVSIIISLVLVSVYAMSKHSECKCNKR